MPDEGLLRVPVIGLSFRPGLESVETFRTALALDPDAKCWAVVGNGEVGAIRNAWQDAPDSALLIVRSPADAALGLACELLRGLPSGPAALLVANLPPQRALFPSKKHAPEAIRQLLEAHSDLQVHLHTAEWLRRPPRIR